MDELAVMDGSKCILQLRGVRPFLSKKYDITKHVADALDIYVNGSLNLFDHHTNVDIKNRVVCFDIKDLGTQLKKMGMLIVQEMVWNRLAANRDSGKYTRYYMDEFHSAATRCCKQTSIRQAA